MRASCDSARRISTRCRLPTDSAPTIWSAARSSISSEASSASALVAHGAPVDPARPGARRVAEEDVLGDGELGKQQQLLIDRRDAGALGVVGRGEAGLAAVDQDRARVGLVDARTDLDQRRLAGAVLAEQRMDLAGVHVERDAGERAHARERLLDVAHLEERRAPSAAARSCRLRRMRLGVDDDRLHARVLQHGERLRRRGRVGDQRVRCATAGRRPGCRGRRISRSRPAPPACRRASAAWSRRARSAESPSITPSGPIEIALMNMSRAE